MATGIILDNVDPLKKVKAEIEALPAQYEKMASEFVTAAENSGNQKLVEATTNQQVAVKKFVKVTEELLASMNEAIKVYESLKTETGN